MNNSPKIVFFGLVALVIIIFAFILINSGGISPDSYSTAPKDAVLKTVDVPSDFNFRESALTSNDARGSVPIEDWAKFKFSEGYRTGFTRNVSNIDELKKAKPLMITSVVALFETPEGASQNLEYNISESKLYEDTYAYQTKLTSISEINVGKLGDESRGFILSLVDDNGVPAIGVSIQVRKGNYIVQIDELAYDAIGLKEDAVRLAKISLNRIT